MEIIARTPVKFTKPFFVFHKITKDVIIPPTIVEENHVAAWAIDFNVEDWREADTMEDLMIQFELLGLIMPDEDSWDFPERSLRLAIPNDELTEIIKNMPAIIGLLDILKDYIIVRNRTQFIYLQEIYPDDRVVFANYIQERP